MAAVEVTILIAIVVIILTIALRFFWRRCKNKIHPSQKTVEFKAHIAIDFGTAGCGLAFGYNKKVDIFNKFKAARQTTNKTKTCILLGDENEFMTFGVDAKTTYESVKNAEVKKKWKYFDRFKMALYEEKLSQIDLHEEKKSKDVDIKGKIRAMNGKLVKSEIVFVAAFKHLGKIAKDQLKKKIDVDIKPEEIQWILTVPAIWSDKSKDRMRNWIIKAELVNPNIKDQCFIVYEPDCASLSIQKQKEKLKLEFRTGEKYILVDAGGGTVDIVCHKILEHGDVEEIIHPTGDAWGSCYIDDLYVKLLETLFTKEFIHEFKREEPSCYLEIIRCFQDAKKIFSNNKNAKIHSVQLPYEFLQFLEEKLEPKLGKNGPERQVDAFNKSLAYYSALFANNKTKQQSADNLHIKLRRENEDDGYHNSDEFMDMDVRIWEALFDSKIDAIISHVDKLCNLQTLRNQCNYLCLVGGFSGSAYFQSRMIQHFGEKSKYKMKIIIPRYPILAVVEGAAWMGIDKDYIQARRLKYTYGIAVRHKVEKARQIGIPNAWIEGHTTNDGRVKDCFGIIASQNDRVALGEKTVKEYEARTSSVSIVILCSEEKKPKTKHDGIELATVTVDGTFKGGMIIVEFHFYGTQFIVYAYPKGKDNDKKEVKVDYKK